MKTEVLQRCAVLLRTVLGGAAGCVGECGLRSGLPLGSLHGSHRSTEPAVWPSPGF